MTLLKARLAPLFIALAALPCLAPPHPARAQMSMGGGGAPGGGGGPGGDQGGPGGDDAEAKANAAANAPPPALPGAVPGSPDMPATHAALDMNPNAALFDAINRGDLTAAKDALSRGADLAATNILGEKPIEMAIDLGRNDITFLLLSMRNSEGSGAEMASGTLTTGADTVRRLSIGGRGAGHAVQEASFKRPRTDAELGGAAKPEIGFLGFNGS